MGYRMKTTVDINDALMAQARQLAKERQQTLKSVLETALRQFLAAHAADKAAFRLRKRTFRGEGLHADIKEGDWAAIRERAYEGRGG